MPSLPLFPQHIQQEIKRAAQTLNQLPEGLLERFTLDIDNGLYDGYPYLFLNAFPSLTLSDVQPLALAGRLFAHSLFSYDKILDSASMAADILDAQIAQFEAYRLLHQLFPPGAAFWERFRRYLGEYADACRQEQYFASGKRPWQEYTESLALEIAVAKTGIAKSAIAGLAELARDDGWLEPLVESIRHYYIARQMWDDLCDWKEDLQTGIPSLLLSRVFRERPARKDQEAGLNQLARELYYGGHAQYVLQLALASLDLAENLTADLPGLLWRNATAELRRQCAELLCDINRIVHRNLERVREQPEFTLSLPAAQNLWQQLAWDALRFIIGQWQLGFGEARHTMRFPREEGFSSHEYQSGDVFQRALIVDALCDADNLLQHQLNPVIDFEVKYLLDARLPGACGWGYFPELSELPPDADDLAQIMQVLLRTRHEAAVVEYCEPPLLTLLCNNIHPDGSFETWILPAERERTSTQERQAEFVRRAWGIGPDSDVMANLLYVLHLYNHVRFAKIIERGRAYLETQQQVDGSWTSTWYHGPYYGTYVCSRLLAATQSDSPAIPHALDFLNNHQRADGGWGIDEHSDVLSTALALLGLAIGHKQHSDRIDADQVMRALTYLQHTQEHDKTWPDCKFIRMEVGRAQGRVRWILSYGSKTIATLFVLKAALAWHALVTAQPPAGLADSMAKA